MSSLNEKTREQIDFKYLPFSHKNDGNHFYTDIVGIHSNVLKKNMQKYALLLANMMTSTKFFVKATKATKEHPVHQYLLPVRHKTFLKISKIGI